MPANLTAQYREAEARFKQATTPEEQLKCLQEMLREIPKHKGTEKMQADIKRRIAKLKKQEPSVTSGTTSKPFYQVDREGIGQVVVCGPANAGKSRLVAEFTRASPEVTDYPFATRKPLAGMMEFEDIQIQLVDTPALAAETLEGWQLAQIAAADIALLIFDVNDPQLLDQTDFVLKKFAEKEISWKGSQPRLLVLGNKLDAAQGPANFEAWQELFAELFSAEPFSLEDARHRARLPGKLFKMLDLVRVYTKKPGHSVSRDEAPFVLQRGSTVLDAASAVHRELAERFQFARIWNDHLYEGQRVERTHPVEDRDVIEIHAG